jgi:hypothetical protein
MADHLKLDLDILDSEGGEVTLGGKTYSVSPPKMGLLLKLSKLAKRFDAVKTNVAENPDEVFELLEQLYDILTPIIPDLKSGNADLNMAQAGALMQFIFEMAKPDELSALKAEGIEPNAPIDDSPKARPFPKGGRPIPTDLSRLHAGDIPDEYAIRAYALMEQAAKLKAADMQDQILIALIPYMDEDKRSEIIDDYANASRDILELERNLDDYSGMSELKRMFGEAPKG